MCREVEDFTPGCLTSSCNGGQMTLPAASHSDAAVQYAMTTHTGTLPAPRRGGDRRVGLSARGAHSLRR